MSDHRQWHVEGTAAEIYERALVPAIFAAWAPRVVEVAAPRPGERVLDVACGTGVVARLVAERVGRTGHVVGLDLNPGMLAVAASAAAGATPTSATIAWREASAISLPFSDESFDVVYCQAGLQFFPDRPTALREMYRVLVPGGRVGLLVWGGIEHSPGFAALAASLARHVGGEAAAIMRAPFGLADPEELRRLLAAPGFRDIRITAVAGTVSFPSVARFVQDQVAGSPLTGPVGRASDDARTAVLDELDDTLRSYVTGGGLAFPLEAHLAAAAK
jgi:ubiquinone/menaquinone biosynthesis C-methylase UbiE